MFKVGDKVVCIDGSVPGTLREGGTYVIKSVSLKTCELEGLNFMAWSVDRFVKTHEYSAAENIKEPTALEVQHGGGHYKGMSIQPVEFIHANNIGYMEGNAIKYLCRWQLKNGLEDLNKAKHYIELLIEMENARNAS